MCVCVKYWNCLLHVLPLQCFYRHDEAKIRKSYFKMAQKYHPDKNPDGRDIFEAVNKAYEFLCSRSSKVCEGPDPQRIVLILTTQSILYKRYTDSKCVCMECVCLSVCLSVFFVCSLCVYVYACMCV